MDAFTCAVFTEKKAPKRIELLGDKTKKPEPAQHVIEFPGGAIELSRTSDGNYWAHIMVNRDLIIDECEGLRRAYGEIVGGRIDAENGVSPIPDLEEITQIALLIKPLLERKQRPQKVDALPQQEALFT